MPGLIVWIGSTSTLYTLGSHQPPHPQQFDIGGQLLEVSGETWTLRHLKKNRETGPHRFKMHAPGHSSCLHSGGDAARKTRRSFLPPPGEERDQASAGFAPLLCQSVFPNAVFLKVKELLSSPQRDNTPVLLLVTCGTKTKASMYGHLMCFRKQRPLAPETAALES